MVVIELVDRKGFDPVTFRTTWRRSKPTELRAREISFQITSSRAKTCLTLFKLVRTNLLNLES